MEWRRDYRPFTRDIEVGVPVCSGMRGLRMRGKDDERVVEVVEDDEERVLAAVMDCGGKRKEGVGWAEGV